MTLIRVKNGDGYTSGLTERDVCKIERVDFNAVVKDAKRVAYRRRQMAKGVKNPEGLGCFHMHVPKVFIDRLISSPEVNKMYVENKNDFWCWMWHRYPDFRCMNQPMCPICGRKTRDHDE